MIGMHTAIQFYEQLFEITATNLVMNNITINLLNNKVIANNIANHNHINITNVTTVDFLHIDQLISIYHIY
jgi:hypothetical protein